MNQSNPRILLKQRPSGIPTKQDLVFDEGKLPEIKPGEVLVRNRFLSLDPYMRGRMTDKKSYIPPVALGAVMEGECVGQVISGPGFKEGQWVKGYTGWQHYASVPGHMLSPIDTDAAPASSYLGVLGMPGTTAWVGCTKIAVVKPGETFAVAAASGAVGSVAGQIAKQMGARVIGIAGGEKKCAYVKKELGFDECIDHRAENFAELLREACPKGIDVYFENVGGEVQRALFPLLNDQARVAFCGMVAEYNDPTPQPGPSLMAVVFKRLQLRGFIVSDHPQAFAEWQKTGAKLIKEGHLKYREDIVKGLENAPEAFAGLLQGKNFGKLVIDLG
ncbi:MAG: NADP-dependent oxidoreductase [Proteobacteria bacterium]|nr:MAG: NADP-dependent oxidoreductase [Pseudomonadota bacterium]